MAGNEGPFFHIRAYLRIGVQTAGKDSHEQVCRPYFSRDRIRNIERTASPVDLHGISWFMRDPHGRFRSTGPLAVLVAELCAHVWDLSGSMCLQTVFRPQ